MVFECESCLVALWQQTACPIVIFGQKKQISCACVWGWGVSVLCGRVVWLRQNV